MQDGVTKKLWSIGGGKGGVGGSIFTLGLGISLASLGKRVILVDADLGGANLHTLMGVRYPSHSLEDFLLKRVSRLEDIIIDTQIEGIGLICGADDILGAANPTYAQKLRILNQIEDLPADYVLLDLGAGTSYNVLDFFNYSQGKICLLTSQATSLQNVYGFIKNALYRQIFREFSKEHHVLELVFHTDRDHSDTKFDSIKEVLKHLEEMNFDIYARLLLLLQRYQILLVVNMVKDDLELQSAQIIQKVCHSFLSVEPEIMGNLSHDPAVELAVNKMVPFPLHQRKARAAADLKDMAQLLVEKSKASPEAPVPMSNPPSQEKGGRSWSRFWSASQREIETVEPSNS